MLAGAPAAIFMARGFEILLPVKVDRSDLHMRCLALLAKAGITTLSASDHLNVPYEVMNQILDGRSSMSLDFLVSFCATCGCSINDVLPFCNTPLKHPYKYVVAGGGGADTIALDPYRIVLPNPDELTESWKEVKAKK